MGKALIRVGIAMLVVLALLAGFGVVLYAVGEAASIFTAPYCPPDPKECG
jgi:type IV secretory pathway TrbD component